MDQLLLSEFSTAKHIVTKKNFHSASQPYNHTDPLRAALFADSSEADGQSTDQMDLLKLLSEGQEDDSGSGPKSAGRKRPGQEEMDEIEKILAHFDSIQFEPLGGW